MNCKWHILNWSCSKNIERNFNILMKKKATILLQQHKANILLVASSKFQEYTNNGETKNKNIKYNKHVAILTKYSAHIQ